MSDRLFFIPCRGLGNAPENYTFADLVIPENPSNKEIMEAADKFLHLIGTRKVFVTDLTDPRFLKFKNYLEEYHSWYEDEDYFVYLVNK